MADSQLLAPWEYEGKRPQVAEAGELLWNRRVVRFELLQGGKELVNPAVDNIEIVSAPRLVIRQEEDDGSWTILSSPSRHWTTTEIMVDEVIKVLNSGGLGSFRCFWFDSRRMDIALNGIGYWGVESPASRFALGRRISKISSSQTYRFVADLLSRSNSDVSFAWKFRQSNSNQRWANIFGFTNEVDYTKARADMNALCQYVLYSTLCLWSCQCKLDWRLLASRNRQIPLFWIYDSSLCKWNPIQNNYLNQWAKVIEQFGPLQAQLTHLCLRESFEKTPLLAAGTFDVPNTHQQLEARLELGNWAREHLPIDVWAELDALES